LYNSDAFGPKRGAGGDFGDLSEEELINNLIHRHNAENWLADGVTDETAAASVLADAEDVDRKSAGEFRQRVDSSSRGVQTTSGDRDAACDGHLSDRPFDENKMTYDAYCLECRRKYKDPTPAELTMCLHAWKYEVGPF
jgi:hypothetical protein